MTKILKFQTARCAASPDEGEPFGFGAFGFGILNLFRISDFVLRISNRSIQFPQIIWSWL